MSVLICALLGVLSAGVTAVPAGASQQASERDDAPGAITGRVTDSEGLPLGGICVAAWSGSLPLNGTTNTLGIYRLDDLSPGEYRVHFSDCAESPTHLSEWYDDKPTIQAADPVVVQDGLDTLGIDAELALGSTISGTVTDEEGRPLANICAWASKQGVSSYDTTDASGAYTVGALAPGDYRINFSDCNTTRTFASEYYDDKQGQTAADLVTVQSEAGTTGIDAELEVGGSISGTVTNEAGEPIAGICVNAWNDYSGASLQTDASGAYTLPALAGGDYRVTFFDCNDPSRYLYEYYDDTRDYQNAQLVSVVAGASVSGIDADLSWGASISGVVTDPAGEPLSGICVSASGAAFGSSSQTDATGSYTIAPLPAGDYLVHFTDCNSPRRFVSEWYRDQREYDLADPVTAAEGQEIIGIDAVLAIGGTIAGTVRNTAGDPLDDVCVNARMPGSDESSWGSTDASGAYEVRGLAVGKYKVHFIECGNPAIYLDEWYDDRPYDDAVKLVGVSAGQTTGGIDAALSLASSITGTVTDEAGAPLEGVCVRAYPEMGVPIASDDSDAAGRYVIGGLRAGGYRVRFGGCGGPHVQEWYRDAPSEELAQAVSVGEGATLDRIDAALGVGSALSGTVTDEAGNPVDMCVYAYDESGSHAEGQDTDALGRYSLGGLAPGSYKLRFTDCSGQGFIEEWYDDQPSRRYADAVQVGSGAEVTGLDAVISEGGSISGTVTGESGEPLADVCIDVMSDLGDYQWVRTDAAGRYRATGLLGGPHQLYFSDCHERVHVPEWYDGKDYWTADPVPVRHGSETSGIDAVLAVGGSISGTITNSEGEPVADICAFAHDAGWEQYGSYTTGEDGTFRIGGLGSGIYELEYEDCDYPASYGRGAIEAVQVIGGADTRSDIRVERNGTVEGTVGADGGDPLGSACVYARNPARGYDYAGSATTDASGQYQLELGPGRYALEFQDCGEQRTRVTEWFDDKPSVATADLVTVEESTATRGIDAGLAEGGGIAGAVTDDLGEPISHPCVAAWDATGEWVDQVQGDASGTYRIDGLRTGLYRLEFRDCSNERTFASEWYRDKPTMELADPVAVTAGSVTTGVDAQVGPGGAISGTVTDAAGLPLAKVSVYLYGPGVDDYAYTGEDGTYRFGGLGTGEYRLQFAGCDQLGPCHQEYYNDRPTYETATPVLVTAGAETRDVDVLMDATALLVLTEGPLEVAEAGGSASYGVLLGSRPEAAVTVSLAPDPSVAVTPATLTFGPDDWNVVREVTVTAVDDTVATGDRVVRIEHEVTSADIAYDRLKAPRIPVLVRDDDRRDVVLTYDGPPRGIRGASETLRATLTDDGGGLAGRTITFRVAGFEAQDETDDAGRATVVMPVTQAYGRHPLEVGFAGDDIIGSASVSADFDVVFEHAFTDQGATILLNTLTRELMFEAAGESSGPRSVPEMRVDELATGHTLISVQFNDATLSLVGEFEIETGTFTAVVKTPTNQYVLGRPPDEGEQGMLSLTDLL